MDGKGRWVDNVFVERLWRSVKYEDIYLRAYETPAALRVGLLERDTSDSTMDIVGTQRSTDARPTMCTMTGPD